MKIRMAGVYLRVSTAKDQKTEMQESEISEFVDRCQMTATVFRDEGQSGAKKERPGLNALLFAARRRKIDVVVVWSLDRLARSLSQLINLVAEFESLGIDFISLKENIDTRTAQGRLMFHLCGAFAEFERELIGERVRSGLLHAKRKGTILGRPALRRLTAAEAESVRQRRQRDNIPFRQLASEFKISLWTAHSLCRKG